MLEAIEEAIVDPFCHVRRDEEDWAFIDSRLQLNAVDRKANMAAAKVAKPSFCKRVLSTRLKVR